MLNPESLDHREYLGDGLYVGTVNDQIVLYSFNGVQVIDSVYLDGNVLLNFKAWLETLHEQ